MHRFHGISGESPYHHKEAILASGESIARPRMWGVFIQEQYRVPAGYCLSSLSRARYEWMKIARFTMRDHTCHGRRHRFPRHRRRNIVVRSRPIEALQLSTDFIHSHPL